MVVSGSQTSTGFSPNKLLFGHTVRVPLNQLYDQVAQSEPPPKLIDYINGGRYHREAVVRQHFSV